MTIGGGETLSQIYTAYSNEKGLNERQKMDFDTPVNQFIADVGDLPVTRITPVHARAFKDSLIATGQAPSTVKGKLSKLKQVVGYAVGNALITENPIENIRVEGSKKDVRPRRSWSTGDLQKLLDGPVHKEGKRPKAGKGEAAFWLSGPSCVAWGQEKDFNSHSGRSSKGFIWFPVEKGETNHSRPPRSPFAAPLRETDVEPEWYEGGTGVGREGGWLPFPDVGSLNEAAILG